MLMQPQWRRMVSIITKSITTVYSLRHELHGSLLERQFLAEQWRSQKKFPETKFVFPNAPNIPITVNMGMKYVLSIPLLAPHYSARSE